MSGGINASTKAIEGSRTAVANAEEVDPSLATVVGIVEGPILVVVAGFNADGLVVGIAEV